jgi:anti-anti-sigma factor
MSILQAANSELSTSKRFSMGRKGGTLIVRPAGPRVGEPEASTICPKVKAAIGDMGGSFRHLVLDLSYVQIMSSYGLGMCIELRNHAKGRQAGTVLFGMCHDIRELFRIMKLDQLFTIALTPNQLAEIVAG